jgi:hypothetical protein
MLKRTKIAVVTVGLLLAVTALAPFAWRRFEAWCVGIHQRSVTRELAGWQQEFGQIRSWEEAFRAIDMLRYIQAYYVPGPGYRSDPYTEAALEAQRQQTMATTQRRLKTSPARTTGSM